MEISRTAAIQLNFPSLGGRGGRGNLAADFPELFRRRRSTANARRTYEERIAKINQFFDDARQYQKRPRTRTWPASRPI